MYIGATQSTLQLYLAFSNSATGGELGGGANPAVRERRGWRGQRGWGALGALPAAHDAAAAAAQLPRSRDAEDAQRHRRSPRVYALPAEGKMVHII